MESKIVAGFAWNDGNREKCQKHGVTIAEIESVFAGTPAIGPDAAHSTAETWFLAIGRASSSRHVSSFYVARSERRQSDPGHQRRLHARQGG